MHWNTVVYTVAEHLIINGNNPFNNYIPFYNSIKRFSPLLALISYNNLNNFSQIECKCNGESATKLCENLKRLFMKSHKGKLDPWVALVNISIEAPSGEEEEGNPSL